MRPLALFLCATISCPAWNSTGHRIIAAVAYDRLKPAVRAKVDALLAQHPDYALLTKGAGADLKAKARAAFLAASVWPDVIKGDRRFWNEARTDAKPTPRLPGFPDMQQHQVWHYKDLPFSPDGTATVEQGPPNAETETNRIVAALRGNAKSKPLQAAYDIPWLIHIEGDLHQPLHCVGRFTKDSPKGDAGGNAEWVTGPMRLHAYWDGLLGRDDSEANVSAVAAKLTAEHGKPWRIRKSPGRWLMEGLRISRKDVYTFGNENGTRKQPVVFPPGYGERASAIARERAAIAGYRLAAILNRELQ